MAMDIFNEENSPCEGLSRVMIYRQLEWNLPFWKTLVTPKVYSYIDSQRKLIAPFHNWTEAWDFNLARACISNINGFGFIDRFGHLVIPQDYTEIASDFEHQFKFNGIIGVRSKVNNLYGIIGLLNEIKTPFEYYDITLLDLPTAAVGYLINKDGNKIHFDRNGYIIE